MQLDACLSSIERYAPYAGRIIVLYRATSEEFADGYRTLASVGRAELRPESDDFRRDVMTILEAGSEHTVFHTDDDVFFRRPPEVPMPMDDIAAFSLRLGMNISYCYTLARSQRLPPLVSQESLIAWDWTRARDDFAYPMSLNGHVIPTRLLLQLLGHAKFENPNELEEELHLRRHLAPAWMMAFRESCLVSIPANVVSSTHANRAASDPGNSPSALNRRFLAGERLNLEAMDFSSVRAAHQEIAFVFEHVAS